MPTAQSQSTEESTETDLERRNLEHAKKPVALGATEVEMVDFLVVSPKTFSRGTPW
jgi:hypothetical protein